MTLLAIDLGLRCGLAWYADDGKLVAYRSTHFADLTTLKRGIAGVLAERGGARAVVVEGDRHLADLWTKCAAKRGALVVPVRPETWRERLLLPREQRDGRTAKQTALGLARQVIAWSGARKPTSLNDDVAEAILLGLWGVVELGWLAQPPALNHA